MVNWSSEGFIERLSYDPQAYTWNGLRLQPGSKAARSRPSASQTSNPLHGNIFD